MAQKDTAMKIPAGIQEKFLLLGVKVCWIKQPKGYVLLPIDDANWGAWFMEPIASAADWQEKLEQIAQVML